MPCDGAAAFIRILISIKVLIKNDLKKIMIKKTIIGDISIPILKPDGKNVLTGSRTGSVTLYKNWTKGLCGSGFTQLIIALIKISQ